MLSDWVKDLLAVSIAVPQALICNFVWQYSFAGAFLTIGAMMMINYFAVALGRGFLGR